MRKTQTELDHEERMDFIEQVLFGKKHAELSAEEKDKILHQAESPRKEMVKNEYRESKGNERQHIGDMTAQVANQEIQSMANKNEIGDKERARIVNLNKQIQASTKMNDNQKEKFHERLIEIHDRDSKNNPANIDPSNIGNQK